MPNYNYKDDVALAYDANKKRLRTEGSIILAAVMNEAIDQMTTKFNEALNTGEILQIEGSRDAIRDLLLDAAKKELEPPR